MTRLRSLALGILLAGRASAQTAGDAASTASDIRGEVRKLVAADAQKIAVAHAASVAAPAQPDVVAMSAYIVRTRKDPPPVVETKDSYAVNYLKTGKLYESVGKKFTTRIMLSGAPNGGAQLSAGISW